LVLGKLIEEMFAAEHIVMFLTSFFTTLFFTPLFIKLGFKTGLIGVDVHKDSKPRIPKTGGLVIFLGMLMGLSMYILLQNFSLEILALLVSAFLAFSIGFVEDLKGEINPKVKPLSLLVAGVPILLLQVYYPRPILPFIGTTRLTKIYPILVLASFPIVCNAVNGLDVLNGSVTYTSIAFFTAILIISLMSSNEFALTVSLCMIGVLTAFLLYNKYPSKVFAGNSGSLLIGAVMATTAIVGRLEVVAIIALLPHILNEMHIIFSLRGFKSAKYYNSRPVTVDEKGISASLDPKSPITLVRMLTARVHVREDKVVIALAILSFYSALLAVLTHIFFLR